MKKLMNREPTEDMIRTALSACKFEGEVDAVMVSAMCKFAMALFDAAPELTVDMEPVAERLAIYYDSEGDEAYTTGFIDSWKLFGSKSDAELEIISVISSLNSRIFYNPVKVLVITATQLSALQAEVERMRKENAKLNEELHLRYGTIGELSVRIDELLSWGAKLKAERNELAYIMRYAATHSNYVANALEDACVKHEGEKHE